MSTHHYHFTYHPCFNTQFRTARPSNNIFALLPYLSAKSESDRAALLFWQGLGCQEKGILAKVVRHSTKTKSRSGSCAWQFCGSIRQYWSSGPESNLNCFLSSLLPSFLPSCSHLESVVLASFPALRVRRRVFFVVLILFRLPSSL